MSKLIVSTASPLPAPEPDPFSARSAPRGFLLVAVLLLAAVVAAGWQKIDSPEFLFHLKAGQVINDTGQVPSRDIFSAGSAVEMWSYIEWAWGSVLGLVYEWGKWTGINIVGVGFGLLTALLLLGRCRLHRARWFESLAVTTLVMSVLIPVLHPSPAMAALPLFVLALIVAETRRLWPMILLPLVTMIWANIHPAFMLALLVPAARLVFPPPSHNTREFTGPHLYLTVIIIGSIFAGLISPHSVDIIPAVIARMTTDAAIFSVHPGALFLEPSVLIRGAVALVLLGIIVASRRRFLLWEITTALVLAGFTVVSPDALNFLLIYLAAPAATGFSLLTGRLWARSSHRKMAPAAFLLINVAVIAGVLLACRIAPASFGAGLRAGAFPEAAAGRLSALPLRASILNPPGHGGYLTWRLWPGWKITIDNRPTLYSRQFREEYEKLWEGGQGWKTLFNLWRITAVMGNNEIAGRHPDHNLFYELAKSRDWAAVYWDSASILYLKSDVALSTTNLQEFRQLKPGLSWPAMAARIKTPAQWHELAADLRRVTMDDPHNAVALEFLRRTQQKTAELGL